MLARARAELAPAHAGALRIAAADAVASTTRGRPSGRVARRARHRRRESALPDRDAHPVRAGRRRRAGRRARGGDGAARVRRARGRGAGGQGLRPPVGDVAAARRRRSILFHVRPGSFHPAPAVTSAVLAPGPRAAPLAPVRDAALFERVVQAALRDPAQDVAAIVGPTRTGEAAATAALAAAASPGSGGPRSCRWPTSRGWRMGWGGGTPGRGRALGPELAGTSKERCRSCPRSRPSSAGSRRCVRGRRVERDLVERPAAAPSARKVDLREPARGVEGRRRKRRSRGVRRDRGKYILIELDVARPTKREAPAMRVSSFTSA